MVLIEAQETNQNTKTVEKVYTIENQKAQPEKPVQQTVVKTLQKKEPEKQAQISIKVPGFIRKFKNVFGGVKGFDMDTVGMPPQKKASFYVKKCWNHMARNEVPEAKTSYDKLIGVYETLSEGPTKTRLYQEVYDIYSRLAEVPE